MYGGIMSKKKVSRASYSIESEYQDVVKKIAEDRRMKQTDVIRYLIDIGATFLGYEPVKRVNIPH